MIKHFILLTAVFSCAACAAAETLEEPHITVYGNGKIKDVPNEMLWSVNVTTKEKKLSAATANHAAAVAKVLEFLKGLKIDEDRLQTSRTHFKEDWDYNILKKYVKIGYIASTDISFTISDFDLYQKLWFGLTAIEGVSIQNTQYAHSDRIRYQNQSRQKAVLDAREKAANLAKTLGSQIGEPLKIEESPAQQIYVSNAAINSYDKMAADESMQVLALGQMTISTQVKVVFKLKNP